MILLTIKIRNKFMIKEPKILITNKQTKHRSFLPLASGTLHPLPVYETRQDIQVKHLIVSNVSTHKQID